MEKILVEVSCKREGLFGAIFSAEIHTNNIMVERINSLSASNLAQDVLKFLKEKYSTVDYELEVDQKNIEDGSTFFQTDMGPKGFVANLTITTGNSLPLGSKFLKEFKDFLQKRD